MINIVITAMWSTPEGLVTNYGEGGTTKQEGGGGGSM